MTPKENKFQISQSVITFRLLLTLLFLSNSLPILARKNLLNNNATDDTLVILSNATNISSINKSFNDFRKMFGVELYDEKQVKFVDGRGE